MDKVLGHYRFEKIDGIFVFKCGKWALLMLRILNNFLFKTSSNSSTMNPSGLNRNGVYIAVTETANGLVCITPIRIDEVSFQPILVRY
jgi:hypothetical protein